MILNALWFLLERPGGRRRVAADRRCVDSGGRGVAAPRAGGGGRRPLRTRGVDARRRADRAPATSSSVSLAGANRDPAEFPDRTGSTSTGPTPAPPRLRRRSARVHRDGPGPASRRAVAVQTCSAGYRTSGWRRRPTAAGLVFRKPAALPVDFAVALAMSGCFLNRGSEAEQMTGHDRVAGGTGHGEWKPTACILCECNCGIEVRLGADGPPLRAHPRRQGPPGVAGLRVREAAAPRPLPERPRDGSLHPLRRRRRRHVRGDRLGHRDPRGRRATRGGARHPRRRHDLLLRRRRAGEPPPRRVLRRATLARSASATGRARSRRRRPASSGSATA